MDVKLVGLSMIEYSNFNLHKKSCKYDHKKLSVNF